MGSCLFGKLLNEVWSEITGKEYYRCNPRAILVNESGANIYGIEEVFGLDFMMSKVENCQMHLKRMS